MKKTCIVLIILICFTSASFAYVNPNEVEVFHRKEEEGVYNFYASNPNFAPYQLQIGFNKLKNMDSNKKLPFYTTISKRTTKKHLFTLRAKEGKAHSFRYSLEYMLGNPKEVEVSNQTYLFPYQHGKKYKLTQGYKGEFSHQNTLALDFGMERGTPISATRNGVVVDIKENSNVGGVAQRYLDKANYVILYHQDIGVFSEYAHLKYGGALVEEGQKVNAGEVIALSGNTGYSRGSHLHFEVFKPIKMDYKTIPTRFLSSNQEKIKPKEGNYYYSYHKGKEGFKTDLGSELSNQDYKDYRKKIKANRKLSLEKKRVDDTEVVFIKNGFKREIEVKIDLAKSKNITTSKAIPLIKKVPATFKVYAFLIKPQDKSLNWGYSLNYSFKK